MGLLAATLLAVSGAAQTAAAQTITVGATSTISDAPIYIADRKGFSAPRASTSRSSISARPSDMVAPLGTGQIDAGAGSASAGLYNAVARGIKIRIVADKASSPPGYGGTKILVRKDLIESGRYRDAKDLKGMRFAMNAPGVSNTSTLNTLLRSAGLSYADVETSTCRSPTTSWRSRTNRSMPRPSVEPAPAIAVRNGDAVVIQLGRRDPARSPDRRAALCRGFRAAAHRGGDGASCAPMCARCASTTARCTTGGSTGRTPTR